MAEKQPAGETTLPDSTVKIVVTEASLEDDDSFVDAEEDKTIQEVHTHFTV